MDFSCLLFTLSFKISFATLFGVLIGCENVISETASILDMIKPVLIGPGEITPNFIWLFFSSDANE